MANALDNTVSAIRVADDTVAATVPVGTYPFRLLPVEAVNGRDELWVLNAGSAKRPAGEISVVSGREHRVLGTIPVVDRPANWLINTAGLVFVVGATARELCVVDVRAGRVVGSARLSRDPHPGFPASGLVFRRSGSLFVLNADATVSRFTAAS